MTWRRVAVVGAGAFGTALALVAARAGCAVILWGRDSQHMQRLAETRENATHLPGAHLPTSILATPDASRVGGADIVLMAVPAQATRAALRALSGHLRTGAPVVACAKGIERGTGKLQSSIIAELVPDAVSAVLSGPGFAEEIAAGLPTAVTIASVDMAVAERLCASLSTDAFRPYASDDLVGVELGGAIKNVLAIACGIVAGRGLGESARAALIARGLAEMMRLGVTLGARPETFMGLSGLGDLVLTATSRQSRNLAFGTAIARGESLRDLLADGAPLVEGALSAGIAAELAVRHGVDIPIVAAVAALVEGRVGVDEAIAGLVNRPLRRETD
jgi:glycerol-3-phosphate dehydrogenase (NAD(P)+)